MTYLDCKTRLKVHNFLSLLFLDFSFAFFPPRGLVLLVFFICRLDMSKRDSSALYAELVSVPRSTTSKDPFTSSEYHDLACLKQWLQSLLEVQLPTTDLAVSLKDGVFLCTLVTYDHMSLQCCYFGLQRVPRNTKLTNATKGNE